MLGSLRKHSLNEAAIAPVVRKKITYGETKIRLQVVKWLRDRPQWFVASCENEQKRTPAKAARDKALGMKPGMPDLYLKCHRATLWLELKTEKGRLSDAQIQVHQELEARGEKVETSYGYEGAIVILESFERHLLSLRPDNSRDGRTAGNAST